MKNKKSVFNNYLNNFRSPLGNYKNLLKGRNKAFTLVELMIVVAILAFVVTSMVKLYLFTSLQAAIAGEKTLALTAAQSKIEEIRNYDYDSIDTAYDGSTFTLTNPPGKGVVYVDSTEPDLLVLEVSVSWRDKYNRIIGEDLDLDGVVDVGEDTNANGKLDSRVTLMSMITER